MEATHLTLNPHVVSHTTSFEEIAKCIAKAIESTLEYALSLKAVERVYHSEDVLWTLRQELPNCEWFECYAALYDAGLLISVNDLS